MRTQMRIVAFTVVLITVAALAFGQSGQSQASAQPSPTPATDHRSLYWGLFGDIDALEKVAAQQTAEGKDGNLVAKGYSERGRPQRRGRKGPEPSGGRLQRSLKGGGGAVPGIRRRAPRPISILLALRQNSAAATQRAVRARQSQQRADPRLPHRPTAVHAWQRRLSDAGRLCHSKI